MENKFYKEAIKDYENRSNIALLILLALMRNKQ